MPSFADALSDEERWAITYYILSLSAWRDPLTGRPLTVPANARAALAAPETTADRPETALDPARLERTAVESAEKPGKPRVYRGGIRE